MSFHFEDIIQWDHGSQALYLGDRFMAFPLDKIPARAGQFCPGHVNFELAYRRNVLNRAGVGDLVTSLYFDTVKIETVKLGYSRSAGYQQAIGINSDDPASPEMSLISHAAVDTKV